MTQYLTISSHSGKNGEQNCHFWSNSCFLAVLSPRISVNQCALKSTASQTQATKASVKSHICVWSITDAKFMLASSWPNPESLRLNQFQYLALSSVTAAVISVNVATMLKSELDIETIHCYYYTDSEIVIGYINNDSQRFHVYVGNRVQHIRDRSSPENWFHVPGKENPADEASRGLTAKELLESVRWFNGPQFLWQQDPLPLQPQPVYTLLPSDNEVRKDQASALTTKIDKVKVRQVSPGLLELDRFNHFSSLNRLKRCIVRLQRATEKLRSNKQMNWRPSERPPLVSELSQAENIILKSLQHHHFESEMKIFSTA